MSDSILNIRGLKISIHTDEGRGSVLDHVDLRIERGQIHGLVGESGCGKSTVGRAILGILPQEARVDSGEIIFEGEDLLTFDADMMSWRIRGRGIGFIPQDPFLSLNPVFRVGSQLLEIMRWHAPSEVDEGGAETSAIRRLLDRRARRRHWERLCQLLRAVQISDPDVALRQYPHQFSGGQRQRLLIAAALACQAKLVIADEPTTALDVTTQLQILMLLKRLAQEFEVSMLFITHDFGVVAQLCDHVTVMYAGQSVEDGTTTEIISRSLHPYTQALIQCHPDRSSDLQGIPGTVPSPLAPPLGCRFHPRCPHATVACQKEFPARVIQKGAHSVRCLLYGGNQTLPVKTLD